ncbi:hypothetical protein GCM10010521_02050 [Streptomyces rameus]|uniref:Uncharacterized protein n=1 Tax=Streptomyces rameus TaxID=68261 RepID=A0ABP6MPI5_9ACTN
MQVHVTGDGDDGEAFAGVLDGHVEGVGHAGHHSWPEGAGTAVVWARAVTPSAAAASGTVAGSARGVRGGTGHGWDASSGLRP